MVCYFRLLHVRKDLSDHMKKNISFVSQSIGNIFVCQLEKKYMYTCTYVNGQMNMLN